MIKDVRDRRLVPPTESALAVIAGHRDEDGALLSPRIAAVELLNVLRPTVATSVYITLLAHALHSFPDVAPAPASDRSVLRRFVQEVRRFYPFFPAVAARSRKDFRWRNVRFPAGRRFLLDLHATNTDPHLWNEPETFNPERFREDISAFALIPQAAAMSPQIIAVPARQSYSKSWSARCECFFAKWNIGFPRRICASIVPGCRRCQSARSFSRISGAVSGL